MLLLAARRPPPQVTIARLMEIAPVGTVDPTPFLYNSTMHAMAGMLSVALVSNALLRPVSAAWHMKHD